MKIFEVVSRTYIALIMFLPDALSLVNKPGIPLISFRRMFIAGWLVLYAVLFVEKASVRINAFSMPYYKAAMTFSLIIGITTAANLLDNPLSIQNYISVVFETIIPVFMLWSAFKDASKLISTIKVMVSIYMLIALYGIVAYLYDYNPLLKLMIDEDAQRRTISIYEGERMGIQGRAQSFMIHSSVFGYMSSMMLIFLFGLQKGFRIFSSKVVIFFYLILILAILLSSARSAILTLIIAIFIYMTSLNHKDLIKTIIVAILIGCFFALFGMEALDFILGKYSMLFTSIIDSFSGDVAGSSSIEMRLAQFFVAWNIFLESPVFGHGLAFTRVLVENKLTPGLLGAESFAFNLLIDLGVIGSIGYFILFKGIYSAFRRCPTLYNPSKQRKLATIGIALLGAHLTFVFSTGDFGILYVCLTLTIVLLRLMYLEQVKRKVQPL